jgi:hypothetical protein
LDWEHLSSTSPYSTFATRHVLSFRIFKLHVANGNCHLVLDRFDMIKHDTSYLEVTTRLHPLHKIKSAPISINKWKYFSKLLSWKTTIMDIVITIIGLEKKNVKYVPSIT